MCRPKSIGVRFKASGGLCVYVHTSILAGIKKVPTSGSENVIIKLCKDFFGLENDLHLIFSYCVPKYSSYRVRNQMDVYSDLENKIRSVPPACDILVMGDLNARTGEGQEFLNNENNSNIPIPGSDLYQCDTVATFPRKNTDKVVNDYGKKLLELCSSAPLRICNGRKLGDLMGNPTCYKHNGLSSVDYGLVSPTLYSRVSTFSVGNPVLSLTDHAPISLSIETNAWCTLEPIK